MQEEKLYCNITGKDVTFHKTIKNCGGEDVKCNECSGDCVVTKYGQVIENQCEHRMDQKCMQLQYRFKDKIEEIK